MFIQRVYEIAQITVPVFSIALVGYALFRKEFISSTAKAGMGKLTYYIALPALIFSSFMKTDSSDLFSWELFFLATLPILILGPMIYICGRIIRATPTKQAALTYSSYWGNNGYMGFPLAINAVGASTGLATAAVINGFTVPFYILSAMLLIYRSQHTHTEESAEEMKAEAVKTFFNPVIITLVISSFLAWIRPSLTAALTIPRVFSELFAILIASADLLGSLGLPLALILVGSNLKIEEITSEKGLLALAVGAKLVGAPLVLFLTVPAFFPDLSHDTYVILILLNAVPGAVANYIISDRLGVERDFIASYLVLSTALSIFTIPFWLYLVL
ncbi:AEC family transporter [Chitinivibrio alkaliphilus]|uniref:Auxin efflux carrier n=1 Tax=Chitinivibrio alkaliphilus ACht1 TaxID=1313304 RepID=U7D8Q1_9BACT|nr:AEC family transporter [Chitinivibrio alkaliphilus]ERP31472.1 hypothetical protein CALK_1676 [Chitinivibrio alkaliphilus ACht1]